MFSTGNRSIVAHVRGLCNNTNIMQTGKCWALLASMLVCLHVTGCDDDAEPTKPTTEKAVARLIKAEGNVDHRAARTLVWKKAKQGMELFNRDAIKTGDGASAVVSFVAGGRKLKLDIEEQSLVIIEAPEGKAGPKKAPVKKKEKKEAEPPMQVARVEKGTVRGVVEPGGPPVKVITPDGDAEIVADGKEPVPFRLRIRKKKLEVAVLKGRARVRSGKSEVRLTPRQVVDVTAKKISKPVELVPYPVLVAPPVDARVEAGTEMELRWTPVPGASLYRVQVSHLVSFAERLYNTTVTVPFFKLPAPKAMQTYVWRVASVDAAGRESEFGYARRFHVQTSTKAVPGQLLHPPDNASLQYPRGRPQPVLFRWRGEAERYELVVARSRSLKRRVVARRRTKHTELSLPRVRRGQYYWGVFALDGEKREALFKKPHKLVIASRRPPYVRVPKAIKWK
jgi:hypothetical protein